MAVSLYMDEHVPRSITDGTRWRGVDVLRAQDDLPEGTPDPALLDRVAELECVLVSFDDDFLVEAARRVRADEPFASVVYARPQHVSIGQCVRDLALIAKTFGPGDLHGRVIYLPL
jgi:hypothetical protein